MGGPKKHRSEIYDIAILELPFLKIDSFVLSDQSLLMCEWFSVLASFLRFQANMQHLIFEIVGKDKKNTSQAP